MRILRNLRTRSNTVKYMVQLAPKRNVAGSIPVRDATSEWISLHSDFFITLKKSIMRSVIPPFLQKGTLGSPVRLQACSLTAHCRCHLFASMPVAEYLYVLAFLFMFILLLYKNFYDIMILQINIIR